MLLFECFTCWCLTCFYPPESANPRIAAKHPFRPPTTCANSDQKSRVLWCLSNLEGPLSTIGKFRICTKFTGFLAAARNKSMYSTVNPLILWVAPCWKSLMVQVIKILWENAETFRTIAEHDLKTPEIQPEMSICWNDTCRLYTLLINIPLQNGPMLSNHIVSNALHRSEI